MDPVSPQGAREMSFTWDAPQVLCSSISSVGVVAPSPVDLLTCTASN